MFNNIRLSAFPEVRVYKELIKSADLYEPLWGCAHTFLLGHSYKYPDKYIFMMMEPVEGMFIPIDEQTGIFSSPKGTLFVPFKDDAKTYDSESLDFTMAREMGLYNTICWIFADSKDECYQQYIVHLKELAKKISDLLVLCKIPDKEHQDMRKIEKYEAKLEAIRIIITAVNIVMKTPEELY